MANEVAERPGVADHLAKQYDMSAGDFWAVIRRTVVPDDATNEEVAGFLIVAREYNLNPFLKQIHAFKSKKSGKILAVIGVDGWTALVNRQADFDGVQLSMEWSEDGGKPFSCTAMMHHKQRRFPTVVTEYFSECWRDTDAWRLTPSRMLRHRAFMQAARLCFGITGGLDEDNPDIEPIDVTGRSTEQDVPAAATKSAPKAPAAPRKSRAKEPVPQMAEESQVIDGTAQRVEDRQPDPVEEKRVTVSTVNVQVAFRDFIDHLGDCQSEEDIDALVEDSDIHAVLTNDEDALELAETAIARKRRAFA